MSTLSRLPLMPHQVEAIDWAGRTPRALLGDEPGLGKSRVAIEAFDGVPTLVVSPALIVSSGTWANEIAKWARHPELFTVVPYSQLNQRVKTDRGGTRPVYQVKPEWDRDWGAVVVDEAHYTKGRKSYWTDAVEKIARRSDAVLEMTGTPIPNWAHELYTILRVLRPEDAVRGGYLGSYWRWALTWFENQPTAFSRYHLGGLRHCTPECALLPANKPCEHYHRFMRENLGDRFLRRLRGDVLPDLPPVTHTKVLTPMRGDQLRQYRSMRKEFIAEVGDEQVVAWTSSSQIVKLHQITTSPWLLNPVGEPRGGKFDRLEFDLSARSGKVVVFAHYRATVEGCVQVARRCGARAAGVHGGMLSRVQGQAVKDFKSGAVDVLVGSLETMSEGLTLTEADTLVMVEKSFKPSRNEQAIRRVHRIGQDRPVTVLDYVTPKSLDERKERILAGKTDHQVRMLSAADWGEVV